jgi:hypothetical protein
VKIFELAAARTRLRDNEAAAVGHNPLTAATLGFDHEAYYPSAPDVAVRIIGDQSTGRVTG